MAKINLRPWREERTAARQKQFVTNVIASVLIAAALVFLAGVYYDKQSDRQAMRNDFLKREIAKLDEKIKVIENLKRQRERLMERLNAIQELQGNRPVIVRNFDELVRVLPDGLHYSLLERKEAGFDNQADGRTDSIQVKGLSLKNEDVSNLMRNLDDSIWFGGSDLSKVNELKEQAKGRRKGEQTPETAAGLREFELTVKLIKPKAKEAE